MKDTDDVRYREQFATDVWDDKPIRCECYSLDHVVWFHLDNHDDGKPELSVAVHLNTWRGFWNRLWNGLKYILGFKQRHGNWDEVLIPYERAKELRAMIDKYITMTDKAGIEEKHS